jgi:uncharacterized protein (TIGR01777 family)
MKKVLITGATGLIGTRLTSMLLEKGYGVNILSRSTYQSERDAVEYFEWDVNKGSIDSRATEGVTGIIHLAGAGIADKRWSEKRKQIIIDSRVKTANLLKTAVDQNSSKPEVFVSASGINYYGAITTDHIFTEADPPGDDFTAECCVVWEEAADQFSETSRIVKLRTGVVLTEKGGALTRIAKPVKFGVGAPLGSGEQFVPFIHLDDICRLYIEALETDKYSGAYNAVAPEYITNAQLTKAIARVLSRPLFLPNIPSFAIKALFGEMGSLVLEGSRASAQKLLDEGFQFEFGNLEKALKNIYEA